MDKHSSALLGICIYVWYRSQLTLTNIMNRFVNSSISADFTMTSSILFNESRFLAGTSPSPLTSTASSASAAAFAEDANSRKRSTWTLKFFI